MTERKLDLERRIEALYSEREGLSTTLDESADRIVMLEKESREQDSMVRFLHFFPSIIILLGWLALIIVCFEGTHLVPP